MPTLIAWPEHEIIPRFEERRREQKGVQAEEALGGKAGGRRLLAQKGDLNIQRSICAWSVLRSVQLAWARQDVKERESSDDGRSRSDDSYSPRPKSVGLGLRTDV
jgi:hypothetical protein